MNFYRLDLSYVGTGFLGWQTQPQKKAIQDYLEKALSTIFGEPTKVVGASRTDSGVHAEHQVAMFSTSKVLEPRKLLKSLNALTPAKITIYSLQKVENFHPITDATCKLYRYSIGVNRYVSPFFVDYCWHLPDLNKETLSDDLRKFEGQHDFKSFCASDGNAKTFVRNILETKTIANQEFVHIYILGEGFLKQMIRNIVGTIVDRINGRVTLDIDSIIELKDRTKAGRTAPAEGLSLVQIFFKNPPTSIDKYLEDRQYFPLAQTGEQLFD
ncbi:MAG: tRNA pseudouridine(38-40) synthase TruA [Pseudobacteriovorax sp.]|nr:tRNA pseudouridine(38-40) synthase TruA [Pseudobacteriovorax sp.]